MYRVLRKRLETGRTGPWRIYTGGFNGAAPVYGVVGQSEDDRNAALGCFCAGTPDKMAAERGRSSVLVSPPEGNEERVISLNYVAGLIPGIGRS